MALFSHTLYRRFNTEAKEVPCSTDTPPAKVRRSEYGIDENRGCLSAIHLNAFENRDIHCVALNPDNFKQNETGRLNG